jgi:hypothetical protein
MNRRMNYLSQVLLELQDRYGFDDPVVAQVKESLDQCNAVASVHGEARQPSEERRSARINPSYWSVKLRHTHQPLIRRDVLAECKRVEHRTFSH